MASAAEATFNVGCNKTKDLISRNEFPSSSVCLSLDSLLFCFVITIYFLVTTVLRTARALFPLTNAVNVCGFGS